MWLQRLMIAVSTCALTMTPMTASAQTVEGTGQVVSAVIDRDGVVTVTFVYTCREGRQHSTIDWWMESLTQHRGTHGAQDQPDSRWDSGICTGEEQIGWLVFGAEFDPNDEFEYGPFRPGPASFYMEHYIVPEIGEGIAFVIRERIIIKPAYQPSP